MSLLFKMTLPLPPCSAEGLSSVPKCKRAGMYLMEKIPGLEKLCSGMSYSAVGHEFNVNESMLY